MVLEETGDTSNKYTYGLRPIKRNGQFYVFNSHGDVIRIIEDGEVVKEYDYDAYGNELNIDDSDDNPLRYCGEYFDKETGTIYLRARYYSPVIGRFSTVDPIRDGLNWYAYCYNNPIHFLDRMGLAPGDRFESVDDAAIDFGNTYNGESIATDTEYGSVIYEVTVYGTTTVEHSFLWWKWTTTEVDTDTVLDKYYTYSEPKKGKKGAGNVGTSNIPNSLDENISYEESAQIHTHGKFYYAKKTYNKFTKQYENERTLNGFSGDDINTAKKRKTDTYVVTQWGDLYKATYKNKYKDAGSPYMMDVFEYDNDIVELYGYKKRF